MSLSSRLLVGALLLIVTLVTLVVWLSGARLRDELLGHTIADLEREARVVAEQWRPGADADSLADRVGALLGRRVTLVGPRGVVLGDSEFSGAALGRLENHAARPEILGAVRAGSGWSSRRSPSAGDEELYVAVRAAPGVTRISMPTRELDRIVRREQRDIVVSGLFAVAVAIALSIVFSMRVSRPIVELRDVARAMAAGDLSRRPSLAAPGEVGDLAAAVHRMAEQLDARLAALEADDELLAATIESVNEGVVVVDPRRSVVRANAVARRLLALRAPLPFPADALPRDRALREALAEALAGRAVEGTELTLAAGDVAPRTLALQARPLAGGGAVLALYDLTAIRRLESVRRDFVANVSHELRTPLSVVSGFAETLRADDDIPPAQRRRFAEAITSSAHRMQRIVDDLLDLSRIESGGWLPNPADTDVAAAAADALSALREPAERKGVALVIESDAARVHADPTALRQVLVNLVENAVRYTPAGGRVTVLTRHGEGGVWLDVRDTGIGIPAEHLPRVFERFYRVDPARSREAGGTGLGLSIVRHLVEAHGGSVRAESAPGRGTTVSAFFPDAPAAAS
jgi:signal transduction histidine kinase